MLWLDAVANVRVHGTLKERPVDRIERERPHLKPLARWPYRPVVPQCHNRQHSASGRRPHCWSMVEQRSLTEYARLAESSG